MAMRLRHALTALALAASSIAYGQRPLHGQTLQLVRILNRAGAYVDDFERRLSGIVAEETYTQESGSLHRELKSDLLLVRVDGGARYVEFRDVFEVDGRTVRNRDDRLARLFTNSSSSSADQLRAIVGESARYNIGSVQRTLNTPTLPLIFLRSGNQHAVVFKLTDKAAPSLQRFSLATGDQNAEFAAPDGAAVLSFEENGRNTLIRRAGDRDLPSRGRFWIDPGTGGVLMTELAAEDSTVSAVIGVRYQLESVLGAMVPVEMRERYNAFGRSAILGRATYARFRSFEVQTTTDIQPPAK